MAYILAGLQTGDNKKLISLDNCLVRHSNTDFCNFVCPQSKRLCQELYGVVFVLENVFFSYE